LLEKGRKEANLQLYVTEKKKWPFQSKGVNRKKIARKPVLQSGTVIKEGGWGLFLSKF